MPVKLVLEGEDQKKNLWDSVTLPCFARCNLKESNGILFVTQFKNDRHLTGMKIYEDNKACDQSGSYDHDYSIACFDPIPAGEVISFTNI